MIAATAATGTAFVQCLCEEITPDGFHAMAEHITRVLGKGGSEKCVRDCILCVGEGKVGEEVR